MVLLKKKPGPSLAPPDSPWLSHGFGPHQKKKTKQIKQIKNKKNGKKIAGD
jgi:hypothetical protein